MTIENIKNLIASFDVDAQIGFTPLSNELPVAGGHEIVPELNKNATLASVRVASKDWHSPLAVHIADAMHPQFAKIVDCIGQNYPNMDIFWNRHCTAGTLGAYSIKGLPRPMEYDFVAYKGLEADEHPYGACYRDFAEKRSTGVVEFLKMRKIKYVIVGGLATDYCVKLTCLQLMRAGFSVFLNLAACRGVAQETTENAINEMKNSGVVIVNCFNDLPDMISQKFDTDYRQDI